MTCVYIMNMKFVWGDYIKTYFKRRDGNLVGDFLWLGWMSKFLTTWGGLHKENLGKGGANEGK